MSLSWLHCLRVVILYFRITSGNSGHDMSFTQLFLVKIIALHSLEPASQCYQICIKMSKWMKWEKVTRRNCNNNLSVERDIIIVDCDYLTIGHNYQLVKQQARKMVLKIKEKQETNSIYISRNSSSSFWALSLKIFHIQSR